MAAVAHLNITADTTGGTSPPASGSFTPTAGRLVFAFVAASDSQATGALTGSANGLTFTQVCTALGGSGPNDTLYFYVADQLTPGSPSSMTVSTDQTGDSATGIGYMVGEVSGMSRVGAGAGGAILQFKTADTTSGTPAITLNSNALTGNPTLFGSLNLTTPVTPPTGWTERADSSYATPTTGFAYHSRDSGFTGTTITSGSGLGASCLIAVEFDSSSAVTTYNDPSNPTAVTVALTAGGSVVGATPVVRSVAVSVTSTATTSLVCTMPSGLVAGDLLLAFYLQRTNTTAAGTPSGWTALASHASGSGRSADSWGKVALGGDTLTVTKPDNSTAAVIMFAITTGTYDQVTWTEGFTTLMAQASTTTPLLPDATSTQNNSLAISVAGQRIAALTGTGLTAPGTWTQQGTGFAENDTDGMGVGGASKTITTAGGTGSYTWTAPNANSGPCVTVIVRPSAGTTPPVTAEVYTWDHTLLSGAGDYVLTSGARDWQTASSDYLPASAFDEVRYWSAVDGQYFPGGVADTDPPTQPGAITTRGITSSQIVFDWVPSTDTVGVVGYRIRLNGGSWTTTTDPTYTALGLTPSTAYTPEVQAFDFAGNYSTTQTGTPVSTTAVADTTPPTQPGQPTATPTGSSVALTWTASTDAVGVTAYDVYRSATSGFTPSAGTLKLTVATNSGTETGVPVGTWYYKVAARDAAGNTSLASTQRSVVVTAVAGVAMLMGFSDSHTDFGGSTIADGWRTYQLSAVKARANQTGASTPLFHAYSPSAQVTGSYASVKADTLQFLEDFYYGNAAMTLGSGAGSSTPSIRAAQLMYYSSGNENFEAGKFLDMTIAAAVNVQRGIYDAVMTESSPGVRKFPNAFSACNPTQNQEQSGNVAAYLHPMAQYLHCIFWSMYPPGRSSTVTDPTYNWPTIVRADVDGTTAGINWHNLQAGHLGRCFRRTWQAQDQARTDTGNPTLRIAIGCGETGIPSDPGDPVTRPYYITYGMAGAMFILADEYDLDMPFACYWDNQKSLGGGGGLDPAAPHNILTDEGSGSDHGSAGNPNPTSTQAWQNWASFDTRRGGTKPAQWSGTPKAAWKHTGNQV